MGSGASDGRESAVFMRPPGPCDPTAELDRTPDLDPVRLGYFVQLGVCYREPRNLEDHVLPPGNLNSKELHMQVIKGFILCGA